MFIEKKGCKISKKDEFESLLKPIGQIQPSTVFEIMQTNVFESKVEAALERVKDSSDHSIRELFDIFVAQSLINDVIQNYAIELKNKLTIANHEIQQFRNIEDHHSEMEELKAVIQKLKKEIVLNNSAHASPSLNPAKEADQNNGMNNQFDLISKLQSSLNQQREENQKLVQNLKIEVDKNNELIHEYENLKEFCTKLKRERKILKKRTFYSEQVVSEGIEN
jgi:hypothetical protein